MTRTILAIAFVASPAEARTWRIYPNGSGDAPTIQAGIDSAATGDTVLVTQGIFHENLLMQRSITLLGEAGPAATIIDGGFRGRVLGMVSGAVVNLTLRNGMDEIAGGGLLIGGSAPTLIKGNIVEDNIAGSLPQSGVGGGLYISQDSGGVMVVENTIRRNVAGSEGGGIKDDGGSPPNVIRGNVIDANRAAQGGGIATTNGYLEYNLVISNHAATLGGGIFGGMDGWPRIENNTLIDNETTSNATAHGAGIHAYGSVAEMAAIRYNLVIGNHGAAGAGAGIYVEATSVEVVENDTWQNDIDDVGRPPSSGNISVDPEFCAVDPILSGNAELQSDSACAPGNRGAGSRLIGAREVGCEIVGVKSTTWSLLKNRFR